MANYPTVRSDFFHANLPCYVLYFQLLKDCWQLVGTFFEQLELQYIWKGSREKNRIFATENSPISQRVLGLSPSAFPHLEFQVAQDFHSNGEESQQLFAFSLSLLKQGHNSHVHNSQFSLISQI